VGKSLFVILFEALSDGITIKIWNYPSESLFLKKAQDPPFPLSSFF